MELDSYLPFGTITYLIDARCQELPCDWAEISAQQVKQLQFETREQLAQLTAHQWVRTFAKRPQEHVERANLRIYVLSDDVGRGQIPRESRKFRGNLNRLLRHIDRSAAQWNTCENALESKIQLYESVEAEDDSLFYIFNTLQSPKPMPEIILNDYAADAMQDLLDGYRVDMGLKTELYPYQRRSAAMMIQRETQPALQLDPRLESFTGPTGRTIYLDQSKLEILREPRSYYEPRGGILAETMGYGKTLISLATILATKGWLPEVPPEHSLDLEDPKQKPNSYTLAETCALGIAKNNLQWRVHFNELAKGDNDHRQCVELLERKIGRYHVSIVQGTGRRAREIINTVYLSSATLVVVPPNLLKQWQREIDRHLQPNSLSIYVLDEPHTEMPAAEELRFYDVVLLTGNRFEEELFPLSGNRGSGNFAISCSCSEGPAKRRACQEHPYKSPLLDLHFLRIIVDEGQRFVSRSTTRAIEGLSMVKVERKWIVSGTPAGGMVGAEVDLAAEERVHLPDNVEDSQSIPSTENESPDPDKIFNKTGLNGFPHISGEDESVDSSDAGISKQVFKNLKSRRAGNDIQDERKSIQSLGSIVQNFLGAKPWANSDRDDRADWRTYVVPNKSGKRKALSLRQVLSGLVVRHQYEDVEHERRLPRLENKLVYLQPCFYDKLSINLFILTLVTNAVTSERIDQDYMFHPRNRKSLEALIKNLRHCGFAWSGFSPNDIEKTCKVSRSYLEKPEAAASAEDRVSLQRALEAGELALVSAPWRAFHAVSEIGLYVEDFPETLEGAWALCAEEQARQGPLLIGATQLGIVQDAVESELYARDFTKALSTLKVGRRQESATKPAKPEQVTNNSNSLRKAESQGKGIPLSGIQEGKRMSESQFSNIALRSRPRLAGANPRMRTRSQTSRANMGVKPILKVKPRKPEVPRGYNALSKTRLVGTSSAKLSYLIDRISELYKDEKILVFYEGDDIAYYCAQALELLGISHLIYASGIAQTLRNEYQTLFNTDPTYRVLLMDLRQAALGLHMASASRVFFINPVWQPAIEAQAIKRAHRIGQRREVYVETLVLKDTIEEKMLQRRKSMTAEEHKKAANSLLDDNLMKDIVQNEPLLSISDEEITQPEQQFARLRQPQQLFGRSILEAYGSEAAILAALSQLPPDEPEDHVFVTPAVTKPRAANGSPLEAEEPSPAAGDGPPSSSPKKRKWHYVDEVEQRRNAPLKVNGEQQGLLRSGVDDANDTRLAKRRRSSALRFADEEDLPLTQTRFLPPEEPEDMGTVQPIVLRGNDPAGNAGMNGAAGSPAA